MYTRSFNDEKDTVMSLPKGYDGVAFAECEAAPEEEAQAVSAEAHGGSFLDSIPVFKNLFRGGIFSGGLNKIGTEEILLLAAAAFLLFSRDGDKECAILLILLVIFT